MYNRTRTQWNRNTNREAKKVDEPLIDYIADLDLIVSAFKQCYNIEPPDIIKLKGRVFLAYLNSLGEDTLLSKVLAVRATEDNELTPAYKKMKQFYALTKDNKDELESFAIAMKGE